MGNLGFQEVLVLAVIGLVVFGPDRLPELARQAGKLISRFRTETSRGMAELKRVADLGDLDQELRSLSQEVRDVRASVGRALTGDLSTAPRPDDAPPPTDPDAT